MFVSSHGLFSPKFDSWCFFSLHLRYEEFAGILPFCHRSCSLSHGPWEVHLVLSLLGVAVTKCCRECQALISSCVWLILLQGRTGMSVVLLVRAYCLQIRAEPAGLSLEQDRGVGARCFSQQPGQNLGVAVELSFASLSMGSCLLYRCWDVFV